MFCHVIVLDKAHLYGILKSYIAYYKDASTFRRSQTVSSIVAIPILGGRIINTFALYFHEGHAAISFADKEDA
jgi:hypothetical protein